jgi:hypothetical protein
MSLGLGLGLGISGGSGPRPDFDWIANGAFRDALTEAARSGFAAGFSSPASREQYWLNGARYPNFLGVPGATYTRTGNRAGLDAAVIYPANVPRIAASSGLRVHGAGTNEARNSTAVGGTVGVIGSGGVLPTNWTRTASGLTVEIVSIVGESVRLRYSGTPTGTFVDIGLSGPANATAVPSQIWTGSRYARLVAGTLPAATGGSFDTTIHIFNSSYAYIGESSSGTSFTGSTFVRGTHTSAALPAGTASIATYFRVFVNNGVPCDFTVEIASPQLEQSAFATDYIPNPNTGASSSAGADDVLVNLTTAGIDVNRPMTLIYQYVNSGNGQANSAEATLFQDSAPTTNRVSSRSQPDGVAIFTRSGVGVDRFYNTAPAVGNFVTVAVSVSAAQFAVVRTGMASVVSTAAGGAPLSLDRLGIGKTEGVSAYSNTGIQAVALIPRALSNAEILALVA